MWTCSRCGARVERSFDLCWRCGTTYQGEEDPEFVTADETPPIDDPTGYLKLDAGKSPEGDLPEPPLELSPCFGSNVLAEAKFVADQLNLDGIPATLQNTHRGGTGLPMNVYANYPCTVVVRDDDLPRAELWVKDYQGRRKARERLLD